MFEAFKSHKNNLLVIVMVVFGIIIGSGIEKGINAMPGKSYEDLSTFSDVLHLIQTDYVEEVEVKELVEGAIRGMLKTLDPHSSFLTPDMYKDMQVETSGSFGGLGLEVGMRDGVLTVISPIEDSPAYKVGVRAADKIIMIEEKSTKNLSLNEAVKLMRGKKGTPITITIMRESFEKPQDFTVIRDIIKLKSVKSEVVEEGIGYVRISSFMEKTGEDLGKKLDELKEGGNLTKGLILDLRNNPGGLLNQAVAVSEAFIDSGLIVYTGGRTKDQKSQFSAHEAGTYKGFPIVVLVNSGSASASEIVAGALQDHKRALVLGERTFGKGSVQTILKLNGGAALRLTTSKYYTPNGRSIQAKGIEPDILVKRIFNNGDNATDKDKDKKPHAIRESDLDRHFENPKKDEVDPEVVPVEEVKEEQPFRAGDNQLQRARDILLSWNIFKNLETTEE